MYLNLLELLLGKLANENGYKKLEGLLPLLLKYYLRLCLFRILSSSSLAL